MLEYNIHNVAVRWRISASIKVTVAIIDLLALTVFEIFTFEISNLENLGQDH